MLGIDLTDESPMAKKKPEEPPKRAGRPKTPEGPKPGRVVMRASSAWLDWMERFKRLKRWETSFFLREAAKSLAKQEKFEPPPEE